MYTIYFRRAYNPNKTYAHNFRRGIASVAAKTEAEAKEIATNLGGIVKAIYNPCGNKIIF